MTVAEVIRPGDKIDIRLLQQIENESKTGEPAKIYKSQVLDTTASGNVEISMPSEGSKLILLPLGVRFEFVFYSKGFLYRSIGQIKERYKKDNIYTLEIELKTQLEKFQRREFYRYECTLDILFYELTEEQAELESTDAIFDSLRDENFKAKEKKGIVVDLSGGGTRFRSAYELARGENIMMVLRLTNDKMDKDYHILGTVISCYRMENSAEKRFECRVKFMIKENHIREEIIRYIFEEERRTRQKVKG